jgi:hypothetical protein
MVAKRDPGFRERGAAGGACQKLHAKFRLEPSQSPADDRLGDAKPARGGRDPPGIGNVHKRPQLFDIHFSVPRFATQFTTAGGYLVTPRNGKYSVKAARLLAHVLPKTNLTHRDSKGCTDDLS